MNKKINTFKSHSKIGYRGSGGCLYWAIAPLYLPANFKKLVIDICNKERITRNSYLIGLIEKDLIARGLI